MVYREAPRRERVAPTGDVLLRLDASGSVGVAGAHGNAGGDIPGRDGGRGGDAGLAGIGSAGGSLELYLRSLDADTAEVSGVRISSDGSRDDFNFEVAILDHGYIDLLALGGAGGAGGTGGVGADGSRGRSGSNATRYSSGGNGGPGGDGGDGGNGSDGGPGNAGGSIVVHVDDADTHLLILLRQSVRGGPGGAPGSNGPGGNGGGGGAGGSGHSWTTSESYTDSQGNRRTRTRHHSNPGGSRGRSGSPGHPGRRANQTGQPGEAGHFEILVSKEGEEQSYSGRYDLALLSFAHQTENRDGVYEPLEKVTVRDVVIYNTGHMPLPAHHDIKLWLRSEGLVAPESMELTAPRGLPASKQAQIAGELAFTISDVPPQKPDDPIAVPQVIRHSASLPAVSRSFESYETEASLELGRFEARYPAWLGDLTAPYSLAAGDSGALRFRVSNQSNRALGRASGRIVTLDLRLYQSELGPEDVAVSVRGGSAIDLSGHNQELANIDAGGFIDFNFRVSVASSAEPYLSATFWLTLQLSDPNTPSNVRPIQYRAFTIRVAQKYEQNPDAEVVLCTHSATTRPELLAWNKVCDELGVEMDVWDVSYQRGFRHDGSCVLDHYRGKAAIVLGNAYPSAEGQLWPSELLLREQPCAHLTAGVSIGIIGPVEDKEGYLIPLCDRQMPNVHDFDAVLAHFESTSADPVSVDITHDGFWFGKPGEKQLLTAAKRLQVLLTERYPSRRFLTVYDLEIQELEDYKVLRRDSLGRIYILPTVDAAGGSFLHADVGDRMADEAYLGGDEPRTLLLLTMSFEDRMARLKHVVTPGEAGTDWVKPVVSALLTDLATEQEAVLRGAWSSGVSKQDLLEELPLLSAFCEMVFFEGEPPPSDSSGWQGLVSMAASLTVLTEVQTRWYDWPVWFARRSTMLRSVQKKLLAHFIDLNFLGAVDETLRKEREDELEEAIDALKKKLHEEVGDGGTELARQLLRRPIEPTHITTDTEFFETPESRVLSL